MRINQVEYILNKFYDKGLVLYNKYDKYIGKIDKYTMDIKVEEGMLMYSVCDENYKELYKVVIDIDIIGMIDLMNEEEGDD